MPPCKSLIRNWLNSISKPTETIYAGDFPCVPGSGNISSHASHALAGSDPQLGLGVTELAQLKSSGPDPENRCRIARQHERQISSLHSKRPILQPNDYGFHRFGTESEMPSRRFGLPYCERTGARNTAGARRRIALVRTKNPAIARTAIDSGIPSDSRNPFRL